MGEAKHKQYSRQQFLAEHKWCVYCGEPATTTDHCPPRCFFRSRNWPESYEFPACDACNSEARLDEQALAVIIRSDLHNEAELRNEKTRLDQEEWERLLQGVCNNQPQIIMEWRDISPVGKKRSLRKAFGDELGDELRHLGWGVANIGPLTQAAIERFMKKLGQALYYRHTGELLEGAVYAAHINTLAEAQPEKRMQEILKIANEVVRPQRNNEPLVDQFVYRSFCDPQAGIFYGVVRFSEQFIFQLITVRTDMDKRLQRDSPVDITDMTRGRHPVVLKYATHLIGSRVGSEFCKK
jgi:hypothetical protein